MNHQKIYEKIIQHAKSENRSRESYYARKKAQTDIYYENHHIIPKCLGGNNENENLVLLTIKEHFVCHKLLTYIYNDNRKIAFAFHKMLHSKNGNFNKSAKDFEYARLLLITLPVSKETSEKIRNSMIGKNVGKVSPFKGIPRTEETKQKCKIGNTGKLRTEETKQNMRKPKSEEHKENMRKQKSEEHKIKLQNVTRSDDFKERNRQAHLGKIPWNKGLKLI